MSGCETSLASATTRRALDEAGTGRSVGRIDQRGVGFEALAQDHLGREAVEHPLTSTIVGAFEAAQHGLQVTMAVEGDAQHLPLHPTVEALDHAVRSRRVRARLAMLHAVPLADGLEGVSGEAGAAVGQHVRDPEGGGAERIRQEGYRRGRSLVILDGEVHRGGPSETEAWLRPSA